MNAIELKELLKTYYLKSIDKNILRNKLRPYYSNKSEMPSMVTRGVRRPSYPIILALDKELIIPYDSWDNIVGYLEALKNESNKNEK